MMKTTTKPIKSSSDKKPKLNLKAALGKYKSIITEKDGCWDEDLKKTISE
ncbi:hypothetical protein [Spirosoma fluviale]|uniref:Uncharacterized protein n=1 Tax=Spirosoma fluviale TaxID=1597977 RepID=A0A286G174_9BACT|nr:hypothetical protein [Spirosoma fluviale]SOD89297.1 hypothetical protein SAMN06269250_3016 [Spirosoma fluviale]